jgi:hypothetical protein
MNYLPQNKLLEIELIKKYQLPHSNDMAQLTLFDLYDSEHVLRDTSIGNVTLYV